MVVWCTEVTHMLRHYLSLSIKVLLRRKVFTIISLFGIVATLTVFVVIAALLDHSFGPGAPETNRDRMLSVMRVNMFGQGLRMSAHGSYSLFDQYARDLPGVEAMTIFTNSTATDSFVDGRKQRLALKRTDAGFWRVFDFTFLEGRPYETRDVENADFVAVITRTARQRLLGGTAAVGRTVEVDGQVFRVVGVVADVSEMRALPYSDVWVPVTTSKTPLDVSGLLGRYQAAVVARDRASLPLIRDEFNSRLARVEVPSGASVVVAPFETQFEGFARQLLSDENRSSKAPLLAGLMTAAGVLLALLPAVNLVNLNVSRILERRSEIGVRKAFGASSRALVGQFLIENVLLTLVGAALAFIASVAVLEAINQSGLIAHAQLSVNRRVFLSGVAVAVAFGIISGAYPAWRMSRLHPVAALKGQAR
jgi:putative ABC transport system permease protein